MTLSDDVNLEEFVMTKDEFSGADIKAICTESGLLALRERRMKVWLDILLFKLGEFTGSQRDNNCVKIGHRIHKLRLETQHTGRD
jgi:ATP-dependent 26S proteasome regulatory subunit